MYLRLETTAVVYGALSTIYVYDMILRHHETLLHIYARILKVDNQIPTK